MGRVVAWVVGAGLVVLCAVFAYLRKDDEGVAYALGAAFGTVLLCVGGAALVALLVVNVGGKGRVFSPWVLLGAGIFGLFSSAVLLQDERQSDSAEVRETTQRGEASCPAAEPPVFARLDGGQEYERLKPAEAGRLATLYAGDGQGGYSARRVMQGDTVVAAVIAVPIADDEHDSFRAGVFEGLRERPGTPKTAVRQVGDGPRATIKTFRPTGQEELPQSFAVVRSGCRSYLVQAAGEAAAVRFAGDVLGAARTR